MADDEKVLLLNTDRESSKAPDFLASEQYNSTKMVVNTTPRPGFRRRPGARRVVLEQEEEDSERAKRSFCRSWCEMWFYIARSRISCSVCTGILWLFGVTLILLTVFSGMDECPTLTGATIFCYLMACLALCLGLVCCCYHWIRSDEDLPHALFCVAYCLLLLFIFTGVAGTTAVFTHYNTLSNGSHYDIESHRDLDCGMTSLPIGVMILSCILGAFFVIMSYVACILALGATSDIKWQ